MDPLSKVNSGQPFRPRADTFNRYSAAARWAEAQQRLGGGGDSPTERNTGIVLVKNATGSDIHRFGVLGISGVVFTPTDNPALFANRVIFTGTTPSVATYTGKFIVSVEPIKAGALGRAYVDGVFPAKIDVSDASHDHADVGTSTAALKSAGAGLATILWKESGTGLKSAVIRVGGGGNSGGFVPVQVVRNGGTDGDTSSYPAPLFDVWLDLEADTDVDLPDYEGVPLASSPSLIAKATMTGTGDYGQLFTKDNGDLLLFDVQIKYTQWTCTTG